MTEQQRREVVLRAATFALRHIVSSPERFEDFLSSMSDSNPLKGTVLSVVGAERLREQFIQYASDLRAYVDKEYPMGTTGRQS